MHVDQLVDTHAVRLDLLLQSFELVQRVKESTHPAGHTVDLVITKSDTSSSDVHVCGMVSDHAIVRFTLPLKKPEMDTQWITSSRREHGICCHMMHLHLIWQHLGSAVTSQHCSHMSAEC